MGPHNSFAVIAQARAKERRAGTYLKGGFRVEYLPEGVDPLDARYNVVQWENRNERGWSIGGSLGDPRTGETRYKLRQIQRDSTAKALIARQHRDGGGERLGAVVPGGEPAHHLALTAAVNDGHSPVSVAPGNWAR